MPKYLNKPLRLEIHADGHVWIDHGTDYEYIDDVAIQIPKGHGRLIDGDELMERMKRDNPQTSKTKWMQILAKNAPTILEAEEADENQV